MLQPPKWIDRILEFYCKPELLEEIQGDLHELYHKRISNKKASALLYLISVIRFFRVSNIKSIHIPLLNLPLLQLNFKAGYRNLKKSWSFSFINIAGLSLSFCACIFISQHVFQQLSYDKFHSKSDRIYRLTSSRYLNGNLQYSRAMVLPEIGIAMKHFFPEIEETARLFPISTNVEPVFSTILEDGKKVSFSLSNAFLADSTFLKIFDVKFISGNIQEALSDPNKIIISKEAAIKSFGHCNVVGEILSSNFNQNWMISGVYEDFPSNSHFKPDALMSWFNAYGDRSLYTWDGFYTYILLKKKAHVSAVQSRFSAFKDHYLGDYLKDKERLDYVYELQHLEQIYLNSKLENELQPTGFKELVNTLIVIGLLVLFISVVNHINLNTSKTIERIKEIAIRKIVGSSKMALAAQFLIESLLINLVALTIAILLILYLHQHLNSFFGTSIDFSLWALPEFWLYVIITILTISFLSSLYPIFTISGFKLDKDLKGPKSFNNKSLIKQGLVTFQFAISLILITCTLGIFYQMDFLENKDLGFDKQQKVVVKLLPAPGEEMDTLFNNKLETIKSNLNEQNFITNSTITSNIPGRTNDWLGRTGLSEQEDLISAYLTRVDNDFINTYNLKLLAGTNFPAKSENLPFIIVNNATLNALDIINPEDAIGKKLIMGTEMEIIGVVESINEQSLKNDISPSMYWTRGGYKKFLTINLTGNKLYNNINTIEKLWKKTFPDRPFQFFFLEDYLNRQYQTEKYTSRIISIFSFIAVVIACMGLFSLASYTLFRKTKEIGIRKVCGATIISLTRSFAIRFSLPLILAAFIAIPFSYLTIQKWLEQYAYKMVIVPELFIWPFVGLFFLALLVIIIQSTHAASKNPVDSLRCD